MFNNPNTESTPKDAGPMLAHADGIELEFEDEPLEIAPMEPPELSAASPKPLLLTHRRRTRPNPRRRP